MSAASQSSLLSLLAALSVLPLHAAQPSDAVGHFVTKVQPLFSAKCNACHGDEPEKIKGEFDMRTATSFMRGGESGEVPVVVGKPEDSPLFKAVLRGDDDTAMPPKEKDKLSPEQIAVLKQWIADGAVWPDEKAIAAYRKPAPAGIRTDASGEIIVATTDGLSPDWTNRKYKPEDLWAYQPLQAPAIDVRAGKNPIDALLNAAMQQDGIKPAPLADRSTLIRRATYDLIGLPPTPAEIAAFTSDTRDDEKAFAALVDRLLASPHYGEHWGRHWLDVVRYADSSGFANDYERGNAWRYRDYVIRAFNEDKPYDRFIMEQIAGDELDPNDPEKLVAAGFLRMGPWELTGMEVAKLARQRFLDDVTDSVGQVFLSNTMQCCRCHDHKTDPLPTRDYYSMQACFATTQLTEREAPFLSNEVIAGFEEKELLLARQQRYLDDLARLSEKSIAAARAWYAERKQDPSAFEKALAQVRDSGKNKRRGSFDEARDLMLKNGVAEDALPPRHAGFSTEEYGRERVARKGLERLKWELDRYEPVALSVYDGRTRDLKAVLAPQRMPADRMTSGELEESHILASGDPFSPKDKVAAGFLSVVAAFNPSQQVRAGVDGVAGRRLALAKWIASPGNPLTSRSIANRIWLWHFDRALAANANNFGVSGKKPTHPKLLDLLASEFVKSGWSFKAMHRSIMLSEAYRRSAEGGVAPKATDAKAALRDAYAVFRPRRLTAEEMRDSMLAITGELNPKLGGIPVRPEMNLEAALQPRQVMGTFATAWQPSPTPAERHRRSIYALKIRGLRDPFMEVFNEPTPELSCEAREASNVTPQVFSLFNSASSYDRSLAFALRLLKESKSDEVAIQRAFLLATGQPVSKDKLAACLKHWEAMTRRHQTLKLQARTYPEQITREAVEENTGEKFTFPEKLDAYDHFVPDAQMADADARTRGLAEVCLVLFNSNEFAYVY